MSKIVLAGSGVVGRAAGESFARQGHQVVYVDVKDSTLASLRRAGREAVPPEDLRLDGVDFVFVSVPTPTTRSGVDLSYLTDVTNNLGRQLAGCSGGYPIIVYRSTALPGTTRKTLLPLLESVSGKTVGVDFGLAFSPVYLRDASALADTLHPPVIVLATLEEDDRAHKALVELMSGFGAPLSWLALEEAEFQKYASNIANATKISIFNLLRQVAMRMGIDPTQAFALTAQSAEGLYNPAYGTRDMGPYAGECLPKDMKAFIHFMNMLDVDPSILEEMERLNDALGVPA